MKTKEEQIRAASEAARRSAESDKEVQKLLSELKKDSPMAAAVLQMRRRERDERERRAKEA